MEVLNLNVDACSLLNETSTLVQLSSFLPLLHLLTYRGDINDNVLVVDVSGNTEAALDVTLLNRSSRDTSIALRVVLFHIDLFVGSGLARQKSLLVETLSLIVLVLILDLSSELAADELLALRSNLLS